MIIFFWIVYNIYTCTNCSSSLNTWFQVFSFSEICTIIAFVNVFRNNFYKKLEDNWHEIPHLLSTAYSVIRKQSKSKLVYPRLSNLITSCSTIQQSLNLRSCLFYPPPSLLIWKCNKSVNIKDPNEVTINDLTIPDTYCKEETEEKYGYDCPE